MVYKLYLSIFKCIDVIQINYKSLHLSSTEVLHLPALVK